MQRAGVLLVLIVAEHEQPILHDRAAGVHTSISKRERSRVHGQPLRVRPDVVLFSITCVHGGTQLVGSAARHSVDGRADEVPLAHIERRDTDLYLLDGLQRNWRNAGSAARLSFTEAEGA